MSDEHEDDAVSDDHEDDTDLTPDEVRALRDAAARRAEAIQWADLLLGGGATSENREETKRLFQGAGRLAEQAGQGDPADDPEPTSWEWHWLAERRQGAGDPEGALRAVAAAERRWTPQNGAKLAVDIAGLRRRLLAELGRHDDALAAARAEVALAARHTGEELGSWKHVDAVTAVGVELRELGDLPGAESALREAWRLGRSYGRAAHCPFATALAVGVLARVVAADPRRRSEAADLAVETHRLHSAASEPHEPDCAELVESGTQAAVLLADAGRLGEAGRYAARAVEEYREYFDVDPPQHPQMYAAALGALGRCLAERGALARAEEAYVTARALVQPVVLARGSTGDKAQLAALTRRLAELIARRPGRALDAAELYDQLGPLCEELEDWWGEATAYTRRADLLSSAGRTDEAVGAYLNGGSLCLYHVGETRFADELVRACQQVVTLLAADGRAHKAAGHVAAAIQRLHKRPGGAPWGVIARLLPVQGLAAWRDAGPAAAADSYAGAVSAWRRAADDASPPELAAALDQLGDILQAAESHEFALASYVEAVSRFEEIDPDHDRLVPLYRKSAVARSAVLAAAPELDARTSPPDLVETLLERHTAAGERLLREGDPAGAVSEMELALRMADALAHVSGRPSIGAAGLYNLGRAAYAQGDYNHALGCFNLALPVFRAAAEEAGAPSEAHVLAMVYAGRCYAAYGKADRALATLREACRLCERVSTEEVRSPRAMLAHLTCLLGFVAGGLDRLDEARAACAEASAILDELPLTVETAVYRTEAERLRHRIWEAEQALGEPADEPEPPSR